MFLIDSNGTLFSNLQHSHCVVVLTRSIPSKQAVSCGFAHLSHSKYIRDPLELPAGASNHPSYSGLKMEKNNAKKQLFCCF